jgi:hypothetical protein
VALTKNFLIELIPLFTHCTPFWRTQRDKLQENKKPSISGSYKNHMLYIGSFCISSQESAYTAYAYRGSTASGNMA